MPSPPLAAGGFHSLSLKEGKVLSWGRNNNGQLGNGTNKKSLIPVNVKDSSDIVAAISGGDHVLALKDDGKVLSWGRNDNGQLGNGTNKKSLIPIEVKE